MNNQRQHARSSGFIRVLLSLVFAMAIAFSVIGYSAQPAQASAPAPNPGTAKFEIRFMKNMIDHHAMAVEMAEMCLEKAIHPELISMCENIIATQSQEIEMMQNWLADWYGISYEPQMDAADMEMMEELAALEGEEFEIAFMEMMIQHHSQAIREGRMCLKRAYHPELRQMCANIIETQRAEIEQMQAWLCEWYGRCES